MDMLRNIANKVKSIREFLSENGRYIVVSGLFLVVTFYSLVIVPNEEKKKDGPKNVEMGEDATRLPDLDYLSRVKTYPKMFSSRPGDAYRIVAKIESSDAATVGISIRGIDGKESEIASFDVPKGESVFREAVFAPNGEYQDIVLSLKEKRDGQGRIWDDTRVFVRRLWVSRLSVAPSMMKALAPTAFGEPQKVGEFLPAHQDSAEDGSFGMAKNRIGQYFRPTETTFSGVRFRAESVGNGGSGKYFVKILGCLDDVCDFNQAKTIGSISFDAGNLEQYQVIGSEDIYEIPLAGILDPEKLYFVGIDATTARTDKGNFLLLRKFQKENSFFEAIFTRKADILSSAVIEDFGNAYRYEYRMGNVESDLSDVYMSNGKLKWSKSLGGLALPQDKDAAMTFRVNTIHPIVSMRVSAKGIDTKTAQFVMEYSPDGKEWKEIPYTQQEKAPQVFDATLPISGRSVVHIRARSVQDGSKFQDWGIKDLAVSAMLQR